MMTCVSERSGIASSGVWRRALHPKAAAMKPRARVIPRFLAHQAIRCASTGALLWQARGLELALSRDQEVAGRDDHVPRRDARFHFDVVPGLRSERHFARRESNRA